MTQKIHKYLSLIPVKFSISLHHVVTNWRRQKTSILTVCMFNKHSVEESDRFLDGWHHQNVWGYSTVIGSHLFLTSLTYKFRAGVVHGYFKFRTVLILDTFSAMCKATKVVTANKFLFTACFLKNVTVWYFDTYVVIVCVMKCPELKLSRIWNIHVEHAVHMRLGKFFWTTIIFIRILDDSLIALSKIHTVYILHTHSDTHLHDHNLSCWCA